MHVLLITCYDHALALSHVAVETVRSTTGITIVVETAVENLVIAGGPIPVHRTQGLVLGHRVILLVTVEEAITIIMIEVPVVLQAKEIIVAAEVEVAAPTIHQSVAVLLVPIIAVIDIGVVAVIDIIVKDLEVIILHTPHTMDEEDILMPLL